MASKFAWSTRSARSAVPPSGPTVCCSSSTTSPGERNWRDVDRARRTVMYCGLPVAPGAGRRDAVHRWRSARRRSRRSRCPCRPSRRRPRCRARRRSCGTAGRSVLPRSVAIGVELQVLVVGGPVVLEVGDRARRRRACAGPAARSRRRCRGRRPQVALHGGEVGVGVRLRRRSGVGRRRRRRDTSPRRAASRDRRVRVGAARAASSDATASMSGALRPGAGAGLGGEPARSTPVTTLETSRARCGEHVVHGRRPARELDLERDVRARPSTTDAVGGDEPRGRRRAARRRGSAPACRSARRRGRRPADGRDAPDVEADVRHRHRDQPGRREIDVDLLRLRGRCEYDGQSTERDRRDGSFHEVPSPVSDVHSAPSHPSAARDERPQAEERRPRPTSVKSSGLEPANPLAPSRTSPYSPPSHDEPMRATDAEHRPRPEVRPRLSDPLATHDGSARGRPARVALFRSLTTEYTTTHARSSVERALPCDGRGRWFESSRACSPRAGGVRLSLCHDDGARRRRHPVSTPRPRRSPSTHAERRETPM